MDFIKRKTTSIKHGLKDIHTKKPYLELVAAVLTIPVLATVIILNVHNLQGDKDGKPEEAKAQTIVIREPSNAQAQIKEKEVIVTKEACKPGIGNVNISSPEDGEEITNNPIDVSVDYEANGYCAVVWSYRVNGGSWSSYDDSAISLFNLENGEVKLELRIKSVVDSSQKTLTRTFKFEGGTESNSTTPTTTPTPSQ